MFSFRTLPPASIRSGFCLRGSAECTARQASPRPSWSASGSSGGVVVVLAAAVAAVAAGPTDQLELFTGTFISQPPSTSWVVYLATQNFFCATSGVSSRTTATPEIKSLQMQVELQSSLPTMTPRPSRSQIVAISTARRCGNHEPIFLHMFMNPCELPA